MNDIAASLAPDSPIVLLDANTYERWPFFAELDSRVPAGDPRQALIIHPSRNLTDGHRYIVALRNMKRADGTTIEAPDAFRAYRDNLRSNVLQVEQRRNDMRSILRSLTRSGVPSGDLYLAWDFTVASTENLTGRMIAMRDDAFASLGGHAPSFTVTSIEDNADPAGSWARTVKGTISVPNYLTGAGGPGHHPEQRHPPDGIPTRNGSMDVPYTCVLPRTPTTAVPTVLYGHGLLGSQDEGEGVGKRIGASLGTQVCAVDWYGMSEQDIGAVLNILGDLSTFRVLPDRIQQAMLNFLFLGRAAKAPDGFGSNPAFQNPDGHSRLAPTIYYAGNSQGGIIGGALTAVAQDWQRVVPRRARHELLDPAQPQRRLRRLQPVLPGPVPGPPDLPAQPVAHPDAVGPGRERRLRQPPDLGPAARHPAPPDPDLRRLRRPPGGQRDDRRAGPHRPHPAARAGAGRRPLDRRRPVLGRHHASSRCPRRPARATSCGTSARRRRRSRTSPTGPARTPTARAAATRTCCAWCRPSSAPASIIDVCNGQPCQPCLPRPCPESRRRSWSSLARLHPSASGARAAGAASSRAAVRPEPRVRSTRGSRAGPRRLQAGVGRRLPGRSAMAHSVPHGQRVRHPISEPVYRQAARSDRRSPWLKRQPPSDLHLGGTMTT